MRTATTRPGGNRPHPIARMIGAALLALLITAIVVDPASGASRRRAPLPDPAVSATSFRPAYAFIGESAAGITFCDRTTNLGRGATGRRLHNTMSLRGRDGVRHVVARRDAPKLPGSPPRRRGVPQRHLSHRSCGQGEGVLGLPPGAYDVVICADVRLRQSNDANNCVSYRRAFYVAKRTWTGAATGSGTFNLDLQPLAETWITDGLVFTFAQFRDGVFRYTVTAGSVSWKTAASANGCDKTGAAVDGSPQGTLTLDYVNDTYVAFGAKNPAFTYRITNSCDPDNTTAGPTHPLFLNSGLGSPSRPLPFGSERIGDTITESDGSVLTWSLR